MKTEGVKEDMDKAILPKEVANALEATWKTLDPEEYYNLIATCDGETDNEDFKTVIQYYKERPYNLAKALTNGYESEGTTEEKIKNYFHKHADKLGGKSSIIAVLNLQGIWIEGVNT